ncbi:MAG: hypothetical protein CSA72_01335 [Rhodobacterales bacterium]|nr:MAG: hypothetical protein CSA72_01335 [Rhodobacterales bacterium]
MSTSKLSLAVATSALFLGGCVSTLQDPNNPNRNTQTGALTGAAAGALIGIATGDNAQERRRGAVLGAALGAAGGGLIGQQLDKQEAELRAQMGSNVGIVNTGDQLIVTMPQDILFATDSAALTGSLTADLQTLAASLNRYPSSTVNVVGHTDNVGEASYNQQLSMRRAQAVAAVLTGSGVAPSRVRSIGRGEDAPVADNLTDAGRAQNRRVEIIITPNA